MASPSTGRAFLIGLVLGGAVLIAAGFEQVRSDSVTRSDFAVIWTGSRVILEGGDPYLASSFGAAASRAGTTRASVPIDTYPPWVTIPLAPLGLLDLDPAAAIWTYGGLLLAAAGLYALLRSALPGVPVLHTLAGLTLVASQPAIATFVVGQWTFLLLGALCGVVVLFRADRPVLAAAATLPLLAKPQLFPFALWALSFVAAGRRPRQTSFIVGLVAVWVTPVLASILVFPDRTRTWFDRVAVGVALADRTTPTIGHWPAAVFGDGSVIVVAAVLLLALAGARPADPRTPTGLATWIGLSLLLATYIRSYDQLLFLVPIVLAAGGLLSVSRRRAIVLGVAGLGLLLVGSLILYGTVAAARQNEDVSVLIALALYAGLVLADRTRLLRPPRR